MPLTFDKYNVRTDLDVLRDQEWHSTDLGRLDFSIDRLRTPAMPGTDYKTFLTQTLLRASGGTFTSACPEDTGPGLGFCPWGAREV